MSFSQIFTMCMFAYVNVTMVKGDGGRAIEEEMKVRKEGHCDKRFNNLIPAAQQFKPTDSTAKTEI